MSETTAVVFRRGLFVERQLSYGLRECGWLFATRRKNPILDHVDKVDGHIVGHELVRATIPDIYYQVTTRLGDKAKLQMFVSKSRRLDANNARRVYLEIHGGLDLEDGATEVISSAFMQLIWDQRYSDARVVQITIRPSLQYHVQVLEPEVSIESERNDPVFYAESFSLSGGKALDGRFTRWDPVIGLGFITEKLTGQEYCAHHSELSEADRKRLDELALGHGPNSANADCAFVPAEALPGKRNPRAMHIVLSALVL